MAQDTREIQGLDNFLTLASQLPKELVSKNGGVVLSALRKGGAVMRESIRAEYQRIIDEPNVAGEYRSTGVLIKSVSARRARRPGALGGNEALIVGVAGRQKYPDGTKVALVAGVLEVGTETIEANAPVRKAFDASKDAALSAVVKGAIEGIDRAVKKLNKRR